MPTFIDALNVELASGEITYDEKGMVSLCGRVRSQLQDDSSDEVIRKVYLPEL